MNKAHRILHIVSDNEPRNDDDLTVWAPEAFPLSLGTRPGELAHYLPIQLAEDQVGELRERARNRGIPGKVLVRIEVEAARQLMRAERLSGVERRAIVDRLDSVSLERSALTTAAHGPLWGYAGALRRGADHVGAGLPAGFELPLSVEQAAGWSADALRARLSPSEWVREMLLAAPANATRWEAAAAEGGCYLADWVLGNVMPMTSAAADAHVRAGRDPD